ncbi:hypothetical protein GRF29_216g1060 [Pseudopithomyces chartarum]|uniref:Uncharacterized protein n=1 Tax=Pseudopithomyces chartarum TaxID=1892770 RepID=A0AAN6LL99_9PLEO|nr:hypothetical protein GRF29_216g1060 [Pseudopithomyces chartarum]
MDPVSFAIAIFGLPTVLVATAKMLRKTVKSIKYAEREVLDLAREMEWFDGTCKRFAPCANETSEIVRHLKSWSKKAKVGYDELLSKVKVLATQPGYRHFTMEMLIARLRWNQSKSFIKYLRASLSVARQSMVAFTNIYHIEKLDREMAFLRSALSTSDIKCIEKMHGKTVEKRIEELQKEIRHCRKERHKIDKELKEATVEISIYQKQNKDPNVARETKVLSQFQRSVERYVEDVLPQMNTGRRPRRLQGGSSLVTSGSTSTTHTQSSESSHPKIVASESPPTTSETTSMYMNEKMQPDKEEAAMTLKHCKNCPEEARENTAQRSCIQTRA